MRGTLHTLTLAFVASSYLAGTAVPPEPASENAINLEQFDTTILNDTITRTYKPCDALSLLVHVAHANQILAHDFYTYTFPFVNRDITTYATLMQWAPEQSSANVRFFLQNTPNIFPATNGIQGYLNLFNTSVLQSIDIAIARAAGFCIPSIIELLKNFRAEQWRIGFLFDGFKCWGRLAFGAQLPLYAVARHYNLPLEDRYEIQSLAHDLSQSGDNSTKIKESDVYPYAVQTRLGLGALVLNGMFDFYRSDRYRVAAGCIAQLPTAITFTTDIVGSNFQKIACRGYLDLGKQVEAYIQGTEEQKSEACTNRINFGKQFINYLGAVLLQTDLDQDNRCKLGVYVQPVIKPEEQVTLLIRGSLSWLLPKKLPRYIKDIVHPSDFANSKFDPSGHDQQFCQQALDTLNNRLTDMLFPACYYTDIQSQLEAQFSIATQFQLTDAWSFLVGYDYWNRGMEYCARTNPMCVAYPPHGIALATALRPRALQQNMFLQAGYVRLGAYHDLAITVGADLCLESRGIGQDFTGVVRFEWKF